MKRGFLCFGHIACGLAAAAAFSALVMCLWNWLMPAIFGLTAICFWQALGLLVLAKLLFGGFGHHHGWGMKHRHHGHIHKKWMKMTPEERREFIEKQHHHFHHGFGCDCCCKEKEENKE